MSITIKLVSIPVDDQAKALEFYTEKFGFEKRADVSQGDYRWLTVTAPEGSPDVELVLEPNANPASKDYQASLREQVRDLFARLALSYEHARQAGSPWLQRGVANLREGSEQARARHVASVPA